MGRSGKRKGKGGFAAAAAATTSGSLSWNWFVCSLDGIFAQWVSEAWCVCEHGGAWEASAI